MLPYQLSVKNAETFLARNDLNLVENFAKETGDFIGLSKVDLMVIAMGLQLARERGESSMVRKKPMDLQEYRPDSLKKAYDAFQSESESSDEDPDLAEPNGAKSDSDGNESADTNQEGTDEWDTVAETR